jgi:RNA polymerase sigma-70 factor (ECF subfamily)
MNFLKYKTDSELVKKYKRKQSPSVFGEIMERYRVRLYSYIMKMVKNETHADDIYQEVWLKIARSLENYQEEGKFSNYLFFIATNACYDHFRRSKKNAENIQDEFDNEAKKRVMDNLKDNTPDPLQANLSREDKEALAEQIELLPDKQREVVLLRGEGFTFKEISEMTGTSLNSLLSRMRYAVDKLRKNIRV